MKIRVATPEDVTQMSRLLQALTAVGKRSSPDDEDFVRRRYIDDPNNLKCSVAEGRDGTVIGFQILMLATEGNIYDVTPGWGVIGTHIHPDAARQGIGRQLFSVTREAARAAGLPSLDATIAASSQEALGFYDAMGFETYRTLDGAICKRFVVTG